jgi:hypothetical protein
MARTVGVPVKVQLGCAECHRFLLGEMRRFRDAIGAAHAERDAYRVLLERLVVAADDRDPDDPEWLEALYAARNELRDDQAKEPGRG